MPVLRPDIRICDNFDIRSGFTLRAQLRDVMTRHNTVTCGVVA